MVSEDFKKLITLIHKLKYHIASTELSIGRDNMEATIILGKNGDQIILKSAEVDFCLYVGQLRGIVDTDGDYQLIPVKNPEQQWDDLRFLLDEDHSKLNAARDDLLSGKLVVKYDPNELIEELLASRRNIKNKKFLSLKRDYYHILANALLKSSRTLKTKQDLIVNRPGIKNIIDMADKLLSAFRRSGNAIKDFKFYKSYLHFDVEAWTRMFSSNSKQINEILRGEKSKVVRLESRIDPLANIYRRCMELSSPVINLARVGLELNRGITLPHKTYRLWKNIQILRSDSEYGQVFDCLDERIRHGDAHCSIVVENDMVVIYDLRSRKAKIVHTYKPEQFVITVQDMLNKLFPALANMMMLHELAMLDLILVSKEYKILLAAIGNC